MIMFVDGNKAVLLARDRYRRDRFKAVIAELFGDGCQCIEPLIGVLLGRTVTALTE